MRELVKPKREDEVTNDNVQAYCDYGSCQPVSASCNYGSCSPVSGSNDEELDDDILF